MYGLWSGHTSVQLGACRTTGCPPVMQRAFPPALLDLTLRWDPAHTLLPLLMKSYTEGLFSYWLSSCQNTGIGLEAVKEHWEHA